MGEIFQIPEGNSNSSTWRMIRLKAFAYREYSYGIMIHSSIAAETLKKYRLLTPGSHWISSTSPASMLREHTPLFRSWLGDKLTPPLYTRTTSRQHILRVQKENSMSLKMLPFDIPGRHKKFSGIIRRLAVITITRFWITDVCRNVGR